MTIVVDVQNYRLDFHTYSERWQGAPATIVPQENCTVFGALWEVDISNLVDLDEWVSTIVFIIVFIITQIIQFDFFVFFFDTYLLGLLVKKELILAFIDQLIYPLNCPMVQ